MKEKFNFTEIDGNYGFICKAYKSLIEHLKREINTDGRTFNFDSQDCFKVLKNILLTVKLIEDVFDENNKSERKELKNYTLEPIQTYIELYVKYIDLFNSYDRKKIATDSYIKQKQQLQAFQSISEEELYLNYSAEMGLVNPQKYFESNFYNEFGFAETNFHEFFYNYALHIKKTIKEDTYNKYVDEYDLMKTITFIDSHILHFVYVKLAGTLFNSVSENNFIHFFDLKNDFIEIEIKQGQTNKVYGLIGKLYSLINNEYKEIWIKNITKNLGLKLSTYKSKNKEYANAERKENLQYKILLDTLFEKYDELNDL